jgi:hypothetical protein
MICRMESALPVGLLSFALKSDTHDSHLVRVRISAWFWKGNPGERGPSSGRSALRWATRAQTPRCERKTFERVWASRKLGATSAMAKRPADTKPRSPGDFQSKGAGGRSPRLPERMSGVTDLGFSRLPPPVKPVGKRPSILPTSIPIVRARKTTTSARLAPSAPFVTASSASSWTRTTRWPFAAPAASSP